MTFENPSFANDESLPLSRLHIALPAIVGWKIFGDISTAIDKMNRDFGELGCIEYELSEDQTPIGFELPLIVNGLVRVRVNDGLINPNPNSAERSTLRKILVDEIADVNFMRVSEEQYFGDDPTTYLPRYSPVVHASRLRAEQARQVMDEFYLSGKVSPSV